MTVHAPAKNIKTDVALPEVATSVAAQSIVTPPKPVPAGILEKKITQLTSTFNAIYKERMNDVPIINDKIEVSVIGFQQWQNSYLCIMITPWFMNILLLPGETENWDDKRETTSSNHTFPSGKYEFLVGYESDIGKYQMCSLFSPMFEFADNNAAVETAEAAIKELMNIENIEESDINSTQLEAIWDGTEAHPDKVAAREEAEKIKADATPRMPLKERMEQPVSRRRLLRGALMLDDDKNKQQTVTGKKIKSENIKNKTKK
jgi:[NiFe] hydrogenase assembly HybE family chaperone